MSPRWARPWFAVTALCVIAGVALSVYSAVKNPGHFHSGVERGFNAFAFFTIQSNLIVGGTTLLLAIRLDRTSTVFGTFRLIGVVAITVTGGSTTSRWPASSTSTGSTSSVTSWSTPWCRCWPSSAG